MPITITYTNRDINKYNSFDKILNFDLLLQGNPNIEKGCE